nr:SIALI-17 repeat-containing surface protein [uncultured Granulicatella sp.]
MKVLRDTDKDGTPDVDDEDDDGDGIKDTEEPGHSKEKTALTGTATNPTKKATEGQEYTSGETPVVTTNKPNAVISSTETKGLKVNAQGKVEGTPSGLTWNGNDEEQTVTIPVTVTHPDDTTVELRVEVKVLRDTDKTLLTAGRINPTNPAVDGQPYTSNEKVINPNKPDTTITPIPTNGLTIDGTSGKVTGTPSGLTWNGDDTEQTVNIPVVITKGNETINETIPVVVHRSSRNGQPEIQEEISEYTKPIGTTGVDESGNLLEPPVVDIPEYTGLIGTTGVDENGNLLEPPVVDIPEYTEPIGTTGVDENGNLITPPSHVESQKLKVVITKWTDEQGNELKSADAKAPSVPGEANEALEAGEIDGYVFVRTEVKGNIVTHIFRKVSSTETRGDNKPQSTPEVPTDNTEHKPETITPNEQTTETENPTVKPKASQNILPNTGTADGLGIFSTAVASILAGLGLFLPVKKEDEEETQNN